jgi:hypothetical protein
MKVISKEDLLLIIPMINDREEFSINDFELILERFGDEWFVHDGIFQRSKESEEMKQIRTAHQTEKGGV